MDSIYQFVQLEQWGKKTNTKQFNVIKIHNNMHFIDFKIKAAPPPTTATTKNVN